MLWIGLSGLLPVHAASSATHLHVGIGAAQAPALLSSQAQQWYQEAVSLVQQGRTSSAIFDTSSALSCELSDETQSLIAYQAPSDYVRLREHRDALLSSMPVPDGVLQVRLLSGQCGNGGVVGDFDAVTQYQLIQTLATGTQQTVLISQRVRGVFVDGALTGPVRVTRHTASRTTGLSDVSGWNGYRADLLANEPQGMELNYGEFGDLRSMVISTELTNGLRRQETFIDGALANRADMYQGRIYGFMTLYVKGKENTRLCHWAGAQVSEQLCQRFNAAAAHSVLRSSTGVGLGLPGRANGPFQVTDVMYPGPAAQAGVLPGDIVMSIDGQLLTAQHDRAAIMNLLAGEAGSTVEIQFKRGQQPAQTVTITRGEFRSVVPPT